MKPHTKILAWENATRLEALYEFRNNVVDYFNNSSLEMFESQRTENEKALAARREINRSMDRAHDYVLASGIYPVMTWSPPPAVGGYQKKVDLILNVFLLGEFQISPVAVIDQLERSIGIYEANTGPAIRRTVNPFFYVGAMIDAIVSLPFAMLGKAGFNRGKVEHSFVGRILKFFGYLVTVAAGLAACFEFFGVDFEVRQYLASLLAR